MGFNGGRVSARWHVVDPGQGQPLSFARLLLLQQSGLPIGASEGPYEVSQLDANLQVEWSFQNTTIDRNHPNGYEWCVNAPVIDKSGTGLSSPARMEISTPSRRGITECSPSGSRSSSCWRPWAPRIRRCRLATMERSTARTTETCLWWGSRSCSQWSVFSVQRSVFVPQVRPAFGLAWVVENPE